MSFFCLGHRPATSSLPGSTTDTRPLSQLVQKFGKSKEEMMTSCFIVC